MEKIERLKEILKDYKKVAIAYSGGCDSHFLYEISKETLGNENVLAIMCEGEMMSTKDIEDAKAQLAGGYYSILPIDVFHVQAFKENWKDRCYHCKKEVMGRVIAEAKKHQIEYVLDGKNSDDEGVYRPGIKACLELGILSPLAEAKLTKSEIRRYSKDLNIVTHDKPSNACLASRFPYNTILTSEKLKMVNDAEALLEKRGIKNNRVRVHDTIARIEVEPKDFEVLIHDQKMIEDMKDLGFQFITLDLKGITSGSYDQVK